MAGSEIGRFVGQGMGTEQDPKDPLAAQINKLESLKEGNPDAFERAGGEAKLQELKDKLAEQQEGQG
jgi:hypothetical protein